MPFKVLKEGFPREKWPGFSCGGGGGGQGIFITQHKLWVRRDVIYLVLTMS